MAFWKKNNEHDAPSEEPSKSSVSVQPVIPEPKADPLEEELLRRFGRIRTALSPGTTIQGKLSFDSPVRIDGKLSGDVFSSQTLLIGRQAEVSAEVEADIIVVLGSLKGNIKAKTKVEIFPGAKVDANIVSPSLVMQEGAALHGKCTVK